MPEEHTHPAEATRKPRDIKNAGPWCWAEKAILRRIRETFDRQHTVGSALGVYMALCEAASDEQSAVFKTTHSHLVSLSGVTARTVGERIRELAELGFIEVETPSLRAPCIYRLLPDKQPLPNATQPLPNVRQRTKFAPLPRSEESEESEESKRNTHSGSKSFQLNSLVEAEIREKTIAPSGCNVAAEFEKMERWCSANDKKPTKRRFFNWLARCHSRPPSKPPVKDQRRVNPIADGKISNNL